MRLLTPCLTWVFNGLVASMALATPEIPGGTPESADRAGRGNGPSGCRAGGRECHTYF